MSKPNPKTTGSTNPSAKTVINQLAGSSSQPYVSPYAPISNTSAASGSASTTRTTTPTISRTSPISNRRSSSITGEASGQSSGTSIAMSSSHSLSSADKAKLIKALESHSVKTLVELRRIEKMLASSPDAIAPMTNAWAHFVNSNNLLSELRAITKSYPFSSECLDEAKWMVISDPQSSRSWNYCWLVLQKAKNQNLIPKHARQLAAKPEMWGGKQPSAANIDQLANACTNEWTRALSQMLRHWDTPPTLPGR